MICLISIAVTFVCFTILSPFVGGEGFFHLISLEDQQIFWQLRVPRITLGFVAGASLGLAGAIFQTIFKNPLASPYTLGVASAASFGATLTIVLGLNTDLTLTSIIFSFFASFVLLSYRGSSNSLLLFGVALGLLFSSFTIFASYLSDPMRNYQLTRWLMGGLDIASNTQLLFLIFILLLNMCFYIFKLQEFDLLLIGDDLAISKGLDVKKFKREAIFLISILVGVVVSLAGPIGFLGILVPHFCRALGARKHQFLLPFSMCISGGLLVFCDYLGRTLIFPAEIPVGVLTALIGAPIFIIVLLKSDY